MHFHHRLALVRLAAKLSLMGADVDGLAYRLHQPMHYGCQAQVHNLLTDIVLSHRSAWAGAIFDRLSEGWEAPEMDFLTWC
jgi:hypothetical protein